MQRVVLKRVEKYFEASKYTLVIYFHKDLSIKEIYNKIIKREPDLEGNEPETHDRNEAIVCPHQDGTCYLIMNAATPIGVIQHEVIHIVTSIFEFMGANHNIETDELYAYLAEHVFCFILSTMVDKWGVPIKNLVDF